MRPTATYRLQLQPGFGFAAAAAVVDYLSALGVSHLYLSPVLQAAAGSAHGYDVVDPTRLSAELGGAQGWAALLDRAQATGTGVVVDLVPNHMAIPVPESDNPAFWDVLRLGRDSRYRRWFDIDWAAEDARVLLPVLGAPLAEALADLRVDRLDGQPVVRYHDHVFPVAPGTESRAVDLPDLLRHQHYRLACWRDAASRLNYRRFFDISTLIGLRVEDPEVFEETHRELLSLVSAGAVDGLRVDHPDGLADPTGYLRRLTDRAARAWVVVEKILEPGERLPADWPVAGTTGYDALHAVTSVLTDPAGEGPLTELSAELTGRSEEFATVAHDAKLAAGLGPLAAETHRLARCLGRPDAVPALAELMACLPVYRTYLRPGGDPGPDEQVIRAAVAAATRARPTDRELFDVVQRRLLAGADEFACRFQQTTGMVMAKGVEDTAFYRYPRLVALNEVGGDPAGMGWPAPRFHEFCARLAADRPASMTALSTHDTKRSEDVRARLLVLAEAAERWAGVVRGWWAAADRHRSTVGPDPTLEYLLWQTLFGAWPIDGERARGYARKAAREAKTHTSWTDPDPPFEAAVDRFVDGVLSDPVLVGRITRFVGELTGPARSNTLSQKLVQLTMPGVPDVYQGAESELFTLVDPDNRRPVDFTDRPARLAALHDAGPGPGGPTKLQVTTAALRLRRAHPDWFADGYQPQAADGPAADHLLAFRRGDALTVATRFPVRLAGRGGWAGTRLPLPPGRWRDLLTGREHRGQPPAAQLLSAGPVALLARAGSTSDQR